MIKNNLQDLFYIDIDKLGGRLQACGIRRIGKAGDLEELGRAMLTSTASVYC